MSAKVKTGSLWNKSKDDLKKQLVDLKTELGQLRTQKIAGGNSSKLTKIHDLRKSIARVLTVINHNQRNQLRLFYAKKKYLPLDLRPKQTRAIRRRLTKDEAKRVTEKQKKRQMHFPQRNYAIKGRREKKKKKKKEEKEKKKKEEKKKKKKKKKKKEDEDKERKEPTTRSKGKVQGENSSKDESSIMPKNPHLYASPLSSLSPSYSQSRLLNSTTRRGSRLNQRFIQIPSIAQPF